MSWSPDSDKGCAFVYERTYFYVDPFGTHAVSPAVAGQYIYELRLDGELRRRSLEPTPGIRYVRQAPICAVKEEHTDPNDCQAYDPEHPPELMTAPVVPKPEPMCPAPAATSDGCGCVHTPSTLPAWLLVVGLWGWPRRRARPRRPT